jgi:hypothetical protein
MMSNLFKSPFYFLFCASFGFLAWTFSFQSELNDSKYFEKNKITESNFSSLSEAAFVETESDINDQDLLSELELNEQQWTESSEEPFSTSPAAIEQYEKNMNLSYGVEKDLSDFTQIAAEAPQIQLEDEKTCGPKRLVVENILKKSSTLSELVKDRTDDPAMPKKCLIHVMRQFNLPDSTRGKCPNGLNSAAVRGAAKPCVAKAVVNVTYNAFVDITSCMNINPKSLLPKLSNESGMLINTLGGGLDAGLGQLTGIAIEETNKHFDKFMQQIEKNAETKPSCARILKYKSLLGKISEDPSKRCGLIAPPENPVKNILYMAMLNKINTDTASRRFENDDIEGKLKKLGLENVNIKALVEAVALASYNAGPATAFNALNEYLDKRISSGKKLTAPDFDFHNPKSATDIDGKEKLVTKIARSYVSSPFIKKGNDPDLKIKLKKVKLLPEKIRTAHLLSFPEFLIYNQNNFDESQKTITKSYKTIGAPGYLGFLADKNRALRESFAETS